MAKRNKAGRPRGRVGLSAVSVETLQAEIARRQSKAAKLVKLRDRLARRLSAIEDQLRAAGLATGGPSAGGRRTRPKNSLTLVDALAKLLKGRTMSVTEASEAVQKAGYSTNSPNFRTIVNQALLKFKDRFKKQGRGKYTAA